MYLNLLKLNFYLRLYFKLWICKSNRSLNKSFVMLPLEVNRGSRMRGIPLCHTPQHIARIVNKTSSEFTAGLLDWITPRRPSIHTLSSYLDESVLRPEAGAVCGRSRVQGADVLSRSRAFAVEVEAVARLRPHQVAQTWNELGRVDPEPWLGWCLGVSFRLSKSLLEESERRICPLMGAMFTQCCQHSSHRLPFIKLVLQGITL